MTIEELRQNLRHVVNQFVQEELCNSPRRDQEHWEQRARAAGTIAGILSIPIELYGEEDVDQMLMMLVHAATFEHNPKSEDLLKEVE